MPRRSQELWGVVMARVLMSNEPLLLAARGGVRQAVAVLAHAARPAALYMMRCSRTLRRSADVAEVSTLQSSVDADQILR